uniref:enolase-phosphatase E1 n=1 Tax=Semicossyphus pulcher TaxID=241346 RepID=UPI0037E89EC0
MEPDSPIGSRVERTFWTVWYYITGAVNRFLRPEPANTDSNDPDSLQESAGVEDELPNTFHTEDDARGSEVDEEQTHPPRPLPGLSQATVAWDLCTTEIDLGPDEESLQYKTEVEDAEDDEGTREEELAQTGDDDAGLLAAKDEQGDEKLDSHGLDETKESDENEECRSQILQREDAAGAEEETERATTPSMEETKTKIQDEVEDGEQNLEADDNEVKLCTLTDLSLAEEANRKEVETAVMHEEVGESTDVFGLTTENENKSDEGEGRAEKRLSDREDDKLRMALSYSGITSEEGEIVPGQERAASCRNESGAAEDVKEKEDERTVEEVEQEAVIEEENEDERTVEEVEQEAVIEEEKKDERTVEETEQEAVIEEEKEDERTVEEMEQEAVIEEEKEDERTVEEVEQEAVIEEEKKDERTVEETEQEAVIEEEKEDERTVVEMEQEAVIEEEKEDERTVEETEQEAVIEEENEDERTVEETEQEAVIEEEKEDERTVEEMEQEAVIEEENEDEAENNRALEEVSEQEDKIQTVREEGKEDDSDEVTLSTKTELHTDGEQEDVAKDTAANQTEMTQIHDTVVYEKPGDIATDVSADERLFDKDQLEEDNTESYLEESCTNTSVTVKAEGETGQEVSWEFKNTPTSLSEGRAVVSQELNPSTCEEAQKGVPAFNNEPDENTTQRFLEEGDSEEVRTTRLPEEVESEELESLQNSGADYLLVMERIEEEQESRKDIKDFELPLEVLIQEPGLLLVEEDGKLLAASMKTGIEQELESDFGLRNEKDLQDGTEELLAEKDEGLCDLKEADAAGDGFETTGEDTLKFLEAEVQKMPEMIDFEESVEAKNAEQSSNRTSSLNEDVIESGLLKQSFEPEDVELENAEIDVEEAGYKVEQKAEEVEKQNKNVAEILELTVAGMVAEITAERNEEENALIARKGQLSDAEAADESESKLNDVPESERTDSAIGLRQDVIDEETLDLWIRGSEDDKKQQQPELAPQMLPEIEPLNEEHVEISSVQSDTEMSSSTAESGFSDQSISEWGTQNSESQLPKSTSTGSLQGVDDMLVDVSESANISELSPQQHDFGSQETAEAEQDEEEESGLQPESGKTQEKIDEDIETEEEIDAKLTDLASKNDQKDKSLTETNALFKDEKTKVESEHVEITASDSQEIKHAESARSRSGSEASSEEGIVSSESDSQDETESEKTLPTLERTQPGDQTEVDGSVLDFTAQRFRIAVKNPQVRPPKDPRSLLHMPSLDPTPAVRLPVKAPRGAPLGGMGIGIKLPGLGAGFPVLKKTQRVVRDENSPESISQEPDAEPEEKTDPPKQDEAQHKPKWMPPRHPGFGNPLMSELKTKLKKTTKD